MVNSSLDTGPKMHRRNLIDGSNNGSKGRWNMNTGDMRNSNPLIQRKFIKNWSQGSNYGSAGES